MIPQRENPWAGRFLYLVCSEPTLEPLYENTAHTGVRGDNERAAKGSQLTRVVPPNFSVPFGETKCSAFLFTLVIFEAHEFGEADSFRGKYFVSSI